MLVLLCHEVDSCVEIQSQEDEQGVSISIMGIVRDWFFFRAESKFATASDIRCYREQRRAWSSPGCYPYNSSLENWSSLDRRYLAMVS